MQMTWKPVTCVATREHQFWTQRTEMCTHAHLLRPFIEVITCKHVAIVGVTVASRVNTRVEVLDLRLRLESVARLTCRQLLSGLKVKPFKNLYKAFTLGIQRKQLPVFVSSKLFKSSSVIIRDTTTFDLNASFIPWDLTWS